jgi:hypothetical protein
MKRGKTPPKPMGDSDAKAKAKAKSADAPKEMMTKAGKKAGVKGC